MMLALAGVATVEAAPPAGVDLDDVDRYEVASAAFLAGPAGCWVFDGTLSVSYTIYTPPTLFSKAERQAHQLTGPFRGRFDQGRWTAFTHAIERPEDDKGTVISLPIRPVMGKIDTGVVKRTNDIEATSALTIQGGEDQGMSLLDQALEAIDPKTTTSYLQWDEQAGAVKLVQDVPVSDLSRSESLEVTTVFPGETRVPIAMDAVFPRRMTTWTGPLRVRFFDGQMRLRGQVVGGDVLPVRESVSVGMGLLGYTIGYEQELTYVTAQRCVAVADGPL